MKNTAYIEDYFSRQQSDSEKEAFEGRILNDTAFAAEVAFYIKATGIVKEQANEEKKKHFRELYQQQEQKPEERVVKMPVNNFKKYLSAASVAALIGLSVWFFSGNGHQAPEQLADTYMQQNLQRLEVKMGTKEDSLQQAVALYNDGNTAAALQLLETMLRKDSSNTKVLESAGIAALKLPDYDKAVRYFSALAADTVLNINPGKLYLSVTLMKRKKAGDEALVKLLLQQIIDRNLEGKPQAEAWLKEMQ